MNIFNLTFKNQYSKANNVIMNKILLDDNKSITLSNLLQQKIGNIKNESDTIQDIFNHNQKGILLRMAFDDMQQSVVPGTFIHNGMYTPNPLYIINPDGESIQSTTVLIASYNKDMFNNLLPGNKISDIDDISDIKMYELNNNALYAHDSNSTDQRMNQYAKVNNEIYNSASEENCAYGRKFGGEPKKLGWGPGPQTILCNNNAILNSCCIGNINDCKNNVNNSIVPAVNCNSGNVANGKGIHQTWDINEFNPMNSINQLYGVQYTINDKSTKKEDNTFGKWQPSLLEKQSNENQIRWTSVKTFTQNLLSIPIIEYSKQFENPGFIPYWIKYGNNKKDIISMFDNIKYERIQDGPNPIQNKLDYIIPWTDNILTLIHMNNSLYEYYFNQEKLKNNNTLDLWWGWTEVPVKSIEPDMSIWANKNNKMLKDYTLVIYIQDDSIKAINNNLTKTVKLYNSSWSNGGASESMDIKYSKKYNTRILTNFNKCFKNSDNTSNIHWNNISSQILKYLDNLINKTKNFGSCSIIFMRQTLAKINDVYLYQKYFFDIDPESIDNKELIIGTLKYQNKDLNIKFKWKNKNNISQYIFEL